jgi:acetylornithine deacetylase/succinyl-diaminopimelate desuccinylase-like protein
VESFGIAGTYTRRARMKLLIEAKYIPDGTVVTKKTGTQEFTVRDNLKIYTYDTKGSGGLKEILSQDNAKYLVNGRGDINIVPGDTVLAMDFNLPEEDGEVDVDAFQDLIRNVLQSRFPGYYVDVNINIEIPQ